MEGEDDRLVDGEERVEVVVGEAVRMLARRLQAHQVDDVDDADAQLRRERAQEVDGGQRLQRRHVAAAGHDDVGLAAAHRSRPTPRC